MTLGSSEYEYAEEMFDEREVAQMTQLPCARVAHIWLAELRRCFPMPSGDLPMVPIYDFLMKAGVDRRRRMRATEKAVHSVIYFLLELNPGLVKTRYEATPGNIREALPSEEVFPGVFADLPEGPMRYLVVSHKGAARLVGDLSALANERDSAFFVMDLKNLSEQLNDRITGHLFDALIGPAFMATYWPERLQVAG